MSDKGHIDFSRVQSMVRRQELHHVTPYRSDKNLGRAYNEAFTYYTEQGHEWICLRDTDTMFLTPDAPGRIEQYINKYPEAGILTCFTNRVTTLSIDQLYQGQLSNNDSIRHHTLIAQDLMKRKGLEVTKIEKPISGMLMVVSRRVWERIKFDDTGLALGVDNDFSQRVLDAGLEILRMNSIYVWHTYRLLTGISNKKHLM